MATLGLIFPATHCKDDFPLIQHRVVASIPVGGRYRLIDFTLSNMVNNGISHVGVIATYNYQSLIDHVGSGKEWDLARNNSGLVILPPYSNKSEVYNTRLDAIKNLIGFIERCPEEYVILTDSYFIANLDYTPAFNLLKEKNADVVCIYRHHKVQEGEYYPLKTLTMDEDGRINKLKFVYDGLGEYDLTLDIWILKKDLLIAMIKEAINHNLHSFDRDILGDNCDKYRIYGYEFDGFYGEVNTLKSYFDLNMEFLKKDVRQDLFYNPNHPIFTKVRGSNPTRFVTGSNVVNSTIGDGCIIEGNVENCVLFRGVHIGKGTTVKNCVIMQDTKIKENCELEYVVTDKDVVINSNNKIKATYDNLKFIRKGEAI